MIKYAIIWVIAVSFINLIVYGVDKLKAKTKSYRTPEKVLLGLSFIGGALGGIIAMNLFRHKTKHWYFWLVNVFSLIIHAVAIIYLAFFL